MPTHTYSILVMRDDKDVKRFRISPLAIRLITYLHAVLLVAAACGVYAGYAMWSRTATLAGEKRVLERELADTRIRMERLENVEHILSAGNPEELQTALATVSAKAAQRKEPRVHTEAQADGGTGTRTAVDLAEIFPMVNLRRAKVDNVQARFADGRLVTRFDLNNLTEQPLAGDIVFKLVTRSGAVLSPQDIKEDLAFSIQRFKRIQAGIPLPEGSDLQGIFAIRVSIVQQGGENLFSETYPLAQIMS